MVIPEELRRRAAEQHGLLTRRQCLAAGLSASQVEGLIGSEGRWQRVFPAVYAVVTGKLDGTQRAHAALLFVGDDAVLSGVASLWLRGLRYLPRNSASDVLIPSTLRRAGHHRIRVHRTSKMPTVETIDGVRHADLARAALDAVRWSATTERDAVATLADAVQRGGCQVQDLQRALREGPRDHNRRAAAALLLLGRGARSAPEADLMRLVDASAILPPALWNTLVVIDGRRLYPDASWPLVKLAAEVDSTEHHGFGDSAELTTQRRNLLVGAGWVVLVFSPRRIREDPAAVLAELERAYLRLLLRQP
jgi:hypothetical protein